MKKIFFLPTTFIVSVAWADKIGEPNPSGEQQISEVLLVAGVIALGGLFYILYRRTRNKS
jgi:LPXTG-motif cell wall-anchored protein